MINLFGKTFTSYKDLASLWIQAKPGNGEALLANDAEIRTIHPELPDLRKQRTAEIEAQIDAFGSEGSYEDDYLKTVRLAQVNPTLVLSRAQKDKKSLLEVPISEAHRIRDELKNFLIKTRDDLVGKINKIIETNDSNYKIINDPIRDASGRVAGSKKIIWQPKKRDEQRPGKDARVLLHITNNEGLEQWSEINFDKYENFSGDNVKIYATHPKHGAKVTVGSMQKGQPKGRVLEYKIGEDCVVLTSFKDGYYYDSTFECFGDGVFQLAQRDFNKDLGRISNNGEALHVDKNNVFSGLLSGTQMQKGILFKGDIIFKGFFKDGLPHRGIVRDMARGETSIVTYKHAAKPGDVMKEGDAIHFLPRGLVMRCFYKDGRVHGEGVLTAKGMEPFTVYFTFENGEKVGDVVVKKDGKEFYRFDSALVKTTDPEELKENLTRIREEMNSLDSGEGTGASNSKVDWDKVFGSSSYGDDWSKAGEWSPDKDPDFNDLS